MVPFYPYTLVQHCLIFKFFVENMYRFAFSSLTNMVHDQSWVSHVIPWVENGETTCNPSAISSSVPYVLRLSYV